MPRPLAALASLASLAALAASTPLALSALTTSACSSSSGGSSPPGPCTLTAPALSDWRLHADGTLLRDSLNRIVFLRGVDAGGRSKFAPYMPFEFSSDAEFTANLASYMDRAASWGIDSMRVPWTWSALESTEGTYDATWMSKYKALLDAAWAHGIYTVVDFHQDIYAEVFCGDGFPGWTLATQPEAGAYTCPNSGWSFEYGDPGVEHAFDAFWDGGAPVRSKYLAAWDQMIAAFADEPGVIGFEPLNEPSSGSANDSTFQATTLTDFFSAMIAHFNAKAPSTLVFVDDTGTAGGIVLTTMKRPAGTFVFAPHFYPPLNPANTDQVAPKMKYWADYGTQWNVPVWIGEFGLSHSSVYAPTYMTATFAALDSLGLGGTEWEYSVETQEWNDETDSIVAGDGGEYPVAQAVIRPFARAVAGSDVTQSFDPMAKTFTVTWTPTSGVSEFSVPARAFPSGASVTVTQGCFDAASVPGKVLVDAKGASSPITLTVTAK